MSDKKVSQLPVLGTVSGNEEVMLVINNKNYRVRVADLALGLSGVSVTAADLGLGNVDNTHDLDKPISTAVQAALTSLAEQLVAKANELHSHAVGDITNLQSALDAINTALGTKLTATDLTALEVAIAAIPTQLAAKADVQHSHDISNVSGLQIVLDGKADVTALAAKADATALAGKADITHGHAVGDVTGLQDALNTLTASAAAQDTAISGKANLAHTHVASEITDLAAAINLLTRPAFTVVPGNLTNASADLQVTFSTTNGYSMSTVGLRAKYKLAADTVWADMPEVPFVNGTLSYLFSLLSLAPASDYQYQVYLADTNSPTLNVFADGTFTTPA